MCLNLIIKQTNFERYRNNKEEQVNLKCNYEMYFLNAAGVKLINRGTF